MPKRLAQQLTVVNERHRLTAEYLAWARAHAESAVVAQAEADLVRHKREAATLAKRLKVLRAAARVGRVRRWMSELTPVAIFLLTASIVTWLGHWDVGLIGLANGLAAALIYVYFAAEPVRLRL